MKDALLVVLVDGLRHTDHPTALRLVPEFGFRDVEASLFTGAPLREHGRLTDYVRSSQSPFLPVCRAPGLHWVWGRASPKARRLLAFVLYRVCERLHRVRLPRASLIPPPVLAHVRPVCVGSPDDPHTFAPLVSVFDRLREAGRSWLYAAPPRVSPWGATDERVEALVYRSLRGEPKDFYFVKFGSVDRASHLWGPDSDAARLARRRVFRRIRHIVEAIGSRTRLRWVLCADHGFTSVSRVIDPNPWLRTWTGDGQVVFVDSTMVRVWGADPQRTPPPPQGMHPLEEVKPDLWGLPKGGPVLGEVTFVASPGCVVWPDYFSVRPPAGMHGYLPHPQAAAPLEFHGVQTPPVETFAQLGAWLAEALEG